MPKFNTGLLCAGAICVLTACGGTTTSTFTDLTPQFTRDVQSFDTTISDVRSRSESNVASVLTATGTYEGQAALQVFGSGPTPTFLGDANLTVDIAQGLVNGNLTNFTGGTDPDNPEAMTGSIKVAGQSIRTNDPADFRSTFAGQLTGTQNTVILGTGTLNGQLRSNPTDSLNANGVANGTTLNGVPNRSAIVNVYAERQ